MGTKAQRAKTSSRARSADHCQRARVVVTVERRKTRESTRAGVSRVVEPNADVESIGRRQLDVWIKAKDLIPYIRAGVPGCID